MPTSVSAGIGAAGALIGGASSLFGGLFGGKGGGGSAQADAAMNAGLMQQASTMRAQDLMREFYEQARGDVAPWRDAGGAALNRLKYIYGLPGGDTPATSLTEMLKGTPGYQFLADQGNEALQRYGTAKGMRNSGAALRGAEEFGENLALTKAWTPYVSGVTHMSDQGLGAAGQSGTWGMAAGSNLAGMEMAGGQALAAGQVNAANAEAAQPNTMSSLMQSLGLVGGLAPSLGRAFNGASGWWGGQTSGADGGGGGGGGGGVMNPYAYTSNPALYTPQWNTATGGSPQVQYAEGGPITAGRVAVVGERGPEVFVPTQPGYIVPNHALPTGAGPAGPAGLDVDGMVAEIQAMFS